VARSEARIFTIVWRDPVFRALPQSAQWLYMFLLSQDDLEYSGLIPLRPRRWTSSASDLSPEGLHRDLAVLQTARFIVVDLDTDEVFVRALMRRDEVWKQWTILKSAHTSCVKLRSVTIRVGLAEELSRIERECMVTGKAVLVLKEFMTEFPLVREPENFLPDKSFNEAFAERSLSGGEGGGGSSNSDQSAVVPVKGEEELRSSSLSEISKISDDRRLDRPGSREDVERCCQRLADLVEQQQGVRPTIGVQWRRATRLMLDKDRRTEQQVCAAIDWCQDDEFWRVNVLSMPTLRKQYIRLQAAAHAQARRTPGSSTTNQRVQQALDLARKYEEQERKELT
jgi:hypothetical protein